MPDPSTRGVLDLLKHPWARVVLEALGILVFFWLITRLSDVLTPVLIGLVLAYILDPVVNLLVRRGCRRRLAVSVIFGSALILLLGALGFGIPKAWHEGKILYQSAVYDDVWDDADGDGNWEPGERLTRDYNGNGRGEHSYLRTLHDSLVAHGIISEEHEAPAKTVPAPADGAEAPHAAAEEIPDFEPQVWLKQQVRAISRSLAGGDRGPLRKTLDVFGKVGYWLMVLVLIPTYGYFFSLNLPLVSRTIIDHVPAKHRERTLRIFAEINQVVGAFFRGRIAICLILGVVAGIGFAIAHVPSWLVLAAVMGVATAIPLAPILVLVPVALLLYLSGAEQSQYLIAGLTYLAVQGLEPVLVAVIMGAGVEMHPVILIVAILAFGALLGPSGALLAVPLAATARILTREFLYPQVRRMAGLDPAAQTTSAS
jgi:predicted PurR-regulated permease PerM